VSTNFTKLDAPLVGDEALAQADQIVRRFGIGFVPSRGVILFDIAEFSLYAPFEQASQLNSLSYSMNSAYTKLKRLGIEVNFARTTTGDGYYVWNRDLGPFPDLDLLTFLILVLIDNAVARREASGNTVPLIRTGFHVGSHYELFQAEGVDPTLYSYIVGDVTITLARMLEAASAGQILVGDFLVQLPDADEPVGPSQLVEAVLGEIAELKSLKMADYVLGRINHHWSGMNDDRASHIVVDKHGQDLRVASLELEVALGSDTLRLGASF
jgi:class 3 adenylate cyclase